MKQFTIPEGMRDLIPEECRIRTKLRNDIEARLDSWGYEEVITPTVEFYKTYEAGFDNINEQDMYKFFDAQGRILMLRADMTIPIARLTATKYKDAPVPLRFRYCANVFKVHEELSGLKNEISDCGVELIGLEEVTGDLEILMTALDALEVVNDRKWVLEIGNINFFREACRYAQISEQDAEELAELIDEKSLRSLEEKLTQLQLKPEYQRFFNRLPWLSGREEMLEEARQYCFCKELTVILDRLEDLAEDLEALGCARVQFDLGKTKNLNYYTGIVFEAYVDGVGKRVLSGGRYDTLIGKYGRMLPAVGFSIKLDALAEVAQVPEETKALVIRFHPNARVEALRAAARYRKEHRKIRLMPDQHTLAISVEEE